MKGMTRPLLRRMSVWVRVMPAGTRGGGVAVGVEVVAAFADVGAAAGAGRAAGLAGRAGTAAAAGDGVALASRTETVSRETGTTMLRVWSDSSAPIGKW